MPSKSWGCNDIRAAVDFPGTTSGGRHGDSNVKKWLDLGRDHRAGVTDRDHHRTRGVAARSGELAREILSLCRQSANRAGLARRAELAAAGLSSEMLALTGLPKPEDVAREELIEESEYDIEPQSWLRSV